jgi:hypothetical protein
VLARRPLQGNTGQRKSASDEGASIRLRLQRMPGPLQVLAISALAARSSGDGTFRTRDITPTFVALRLQPPANVSTYLTRLQSQRLIMRPSPETWAITPEGDAYLQDKSAGVATEALEAELATLSGSELGQQKHAIIPPFLAPTGTETGLQRMFASSSFDMNVMLISRFPKPSEPLNDLIEGLRNVLRLHSMKLQVASDSTNQDLLWSNVVTYMWGCRYAIVLIDRSEILNANVLVEIGGMLMTGRRCAILKDHHSPSLPTDLIGHIFKEVDFQDPEAPLRLVHQWLADDLGFLRCNSCPPALCDTHLTPEISKDDLSKEEQRWR